MTNRMFEDYEEINNEKLFEDIEKSINSNEKYSCTNLYIQLTRKCNFSCEHCFAGDAQDVTMSKKIIDKIFDEIQDVKGFLHIMGGEPLIAIDTFEYFINKLIESKWKPSFFGFITNGNVVSSNQKIIDLLCRLVEEKDIVCSVGISIDEFHAKFDKDNAIAKSTYDFFVSELKKRNKYTLKDVKGKISIYTNDVTNSLNGAGRFKKYTYEKHPKFNVKPCLMKNGLHLIDIENNTIFCSIEIFANGNVCNWVSYSHEDSDISSFGNLLKNNFKEIIDNHNFNSLFICTEIKNYYNVVYNSKFNPKVQLREPLIAYLCLQLMRFEKTMQIRKRIHKKYPNVPGWIIAKKIPMPTENQWNLMLFDMYQNKYQKSNGEKTEDVFKFDLEQMQKFLNMFDDDWNEFSYPFDIYSNFDDLVLNSKLLKEFEILNNK